MTDDTNKSIVRRDNYGDTSTGKKAVSVEQRQVRATAFLAVYVNAIVLVVIVTWQHRFVQYQIGV